MSLDFTTDSKLETVFAQPMNESIENACKSY